MGINYCYPLKLLLIIACIFLSIITDVPDPSQWEHCQSAKSIIYNYVQYHNIKDD